MCEKLTVHVRLIPYGNLQDAAKLHHYELRRRNMVRDAGKEPNPFVLERWMVNYARHALTDYDQQCHDLDQDRYVELRTATLDAIADTYPPLRHECERQKRIQNPEKEPE